MIILIVPLIAAIVAGALVGLCHFYCTKKQFDRYIKNDFIVQYENINGETFEQYITYDKQTKAWYNVGEIFSESSYINDKMFIQIFNMLKGFHNATFEYFDDYIRQCQFGQNFTSRANIIIPKNEIEDVIRGPLIFIQAEDDGNANMMQICSDFFEFHSDEKYYRFIIRKHIEEPYFRLCIVRSNGDKVVFSLYRVFWYPKI